MIFKISNLSSGNIIAGIGALVLAGKYKNVQQV
jgi:hypothetical protein